MAYTTDTTRVPLRETVPPHSGNPLQVFLDLLRDVFDLFRREAALAGTEIKENAVKAAVLIGLIAGGAVFALGGVFVMLMGLSGLMSMAYGADPAVVVPEAGGELTVGALVVIVGALTAYFSLNRLPKGGLLPKKSVANLREDLTTLKQGLFR